MQPKDTRSEAPDREERDRSGYGYGGDRPAYATTGYAYGGGGDRDYGYTYGDDRSESRARAEPIGPGGQRGKGPAGYQRSDERIKEEACEVLTLDDQVDASGIAVEVAQGEVILSGHVPDRRTKRLAEACVENLSGVKDVQNQLRIQGEATPRGEPGRKHGAATPDKGGADRPKA